MIPISRKNAARSGLTRFFTGDPCRNGHISERRICDGKCVECKNSILKNWIENNRDRSRQIKRNYEKRNPQKTKDRQKQYRKENSELLALRRKAKYPLWKEYYKKYGDEWRKKNRLRLNETTRRRLQTNINARLALNMRCRIGKALSGACRSEATIKLLGCSIERFKLHLSKSFSEGMSFDNYGKWQVDHIVPCAHFDLTKIEDREACFNFRNCKPLWAGHNASKGAKITPEIVLFSKRLRSLLSKSASL